MKTLTQSLFAFFCLILSAQVYAQGRRHVEVDGINYTIIREADCKLPPKSEQFCQRKLNS